MIIYGDRILVEKIDNPTIVDTEKKSEGGIILDTDFKDTTETQFGNVIQLGTEIDTPDYWVDKGDTVFFHQASGRKIIIEDKEFLVMRYSDLYGKL